MTEPMADRRLDAWGVIGTVICCALWGGNAVATKYAISPDGLPAFGCAGLRFLICLPIVAWVCRRSPTGLRFRRRDAWLYLAHGFITALQIGTYNWGTSYSEAGRSSVFINIHPLVVAPLAWIFLGERLGARGLIGLGSATIGVALILARRLVQGGGLTGDFVVLLSGIIFGAQTVAQKLTFSRIPSTTLLLAQTVVAIPCTILLSLVFERDAGFQFTRASVAGMLYQGIAVSGICFSLWAILLARYPASRLATIAFLTPLFGLTFSNLTRGDQLTPSLLLGGLLVGLGIYLVASGRATRTGSEPSPTASTH